MQRNISIQHPNQSFLKTTRIDNWWVGPLLTSIGLLAFIFYSTWAAFQNEHYQWGPYLSPFYGPLLEFEWWSLSPSFLIFWATAGFRITCYYFRKACYRSFFLTPSAYAIGARPQKYRVERYLLLFQKLHCYFLYIVLIFCVILSCDAIVSLSFENGLGEGVGTVV